MTQVLIVEDQKMIRESLENLVAQADDLSPAGSLSCAALAEQYCMRGNIDLILMDVCTENDESGFVAYRAITAEQPFIAAFIKIEVIAKCVTHMTAGSIDFNYIIIIVFFRSFEKAHMFHPFFSSFLRTAPAFSVFLSQLYKSTLYLIVNLKRRTLY